MTVDPCRVKVSIRLLSIISEFCWSLVNDIFEITRGSCLYMESGFMCQDDGGQE